MEATMNENDMERYKEMLKESFEKGFSDDYLELLINGIYRNGKLDGMREILK